jgi:hypothetical protein
MNNQPQKRVWRPNTRPTYGRYDKLYAEFRAACKNVLSAPKDGVYTKYVDLPK